MSRIARVAIAALAAVALVGCTASGAADGHAGHTGADAQGADRGAIGRNSPVSAAMPTLSGGEAGIGELRVSCALTDVRQIDPILARGLEVSQHLHVFYGARGVTPEFDGLTPDAYATSCDNTADRSSYWHPAIALDGEEIEPEGIRFYYRSPAFDAAIETPPLGFQMIGDRTSYRCGSTGDFLLGIPASCAPSTPLEIAIDYPQCWNGGDDWNADLEYAIYAPDGSVVCPVGYDRWIPWMQLVIRTGLSGEVGGVVFSSDAFTPRHSDSIISWTGIALDAFVHGCLERREPCAA